MSELKLYNLSENTPFNWHKNMYQKDNLVFNEIITLYALKNIIKKASTPESMGQIIFKLYTWQGLYLEYTKDPCNSIIKT